MNKKLSERAKVLLWIVAEHTERDWETGELHRFFVPQSDAYFVRRNGRMDSSYVSGSRDANALKGLERAGLIERPKTSLPNKYVYALTEDGLLAVEQLRESGEFED